MIPFVPRSVSGTVRQNPLPPATMVEVPRIPPAQAPPSARVEAVACGLMHLLSPWWCERRDDPLAKLVLTSMHEPVHIAQILMDPHVHLLRCESSAELDAALRVLEPFGFVQMPRPYAYHVCFTPLAYPETIYVENVPDGYRSAVQLASLLISVVPERAASQCIQAVYTVSEDGNPGTMPTTHCQFRHAFVVLDGQTAAQLLDLWGWDLDTRARVARVKFPDTSYHAVIEATSSHLRCMRLDRWRELRSQYTNWQRLLVQRNTASARSRAESLRENGDDSREKTESRRKRARPKPAPPAAPPTDNPRTILRLPLRTGQVKEQGVYKSEVSRAVPNAIDYVDLRPRSHAVYLRCSTPADTERVLEVLRTSTSESLRRLVPLDVALAAVVLSGEELQQYWAGLPARVRNAAVRRAAGG